MTTILKGDSGMIKPNQDVRIELKSSGIKQWQIAEKLFMSEPNFSRKLRKELSEEEKKIILKIIQSMKGEK